MEIHLHDKKGLKFLLSVFAICSYLQKQLQISILFYSALILPFSKIFSVAIFDGTVAFH